jgi:hypothetical protein
VLAVPEVVAGDARTDTIDVRWHPDADAVPGGLARRRRPIAVVAQAISFRLNGPRTLPIEIAGQRRSVPVMPVNASPAPWAPTTAGIVLDLEGRAFTARIAPPPTVESALRRHLLPPALGRGHRGSHAGRPRIRVATGRAVESPQVLPSSSRP